MVQEAMEGARLAPGGSSIALVALFAASWQAKGHLAGIAAGVLSSHICITADWSLSPCAWAIACLPYTLPRRESVGEHIVVPDPITLIYDLIQKYPLYSKSL